METLYFSEMVVPAYRIMQCIKLDDHKMASSHLDNFKIQMNASSKNNILRCDIPFFACRTCNDMDIVLQYTVFIIENPIAATCFSRTEQPSSICMYQKM